MFGTRLSLVLTLAATALAAGCGAQRTAPPDVSTPARAEGTRPVRLPAAGVDFTAPGNWPPLTTTSAGLAGGIASGTATLAVWRWPRTETLPTGPAELRRALNRLVTQIKARDARIEIDARRTTRVDGQPALDLTTTQTTAGSVRRYRSVHVFADGAELVLDGSAPPDQFDRVDETVFAPAVESLRVSAPAG